MGALPANIPANPYIPNARARANTINQMDSAVPPALARLQHMNQDVIGGRNALTPVLNRDDAMREWERRQAGKASAAQPYPQLEYLQQQAEMASTTGMNSWGGAHTRYPPPPSKLSHAYQPQTIMVDDDNNSRRDAVMSNVRSAARADGSGGVYGAQNVISSPPQAYSSNSTTTGNRYPATYNQNQAVTGFDSLDRRTDIGNMYVPMQADPYQGYNVAQPPPPPSARHANAPTQAVPASFYGTAIPTGQLNATQNRNPFHAEPAPPTSAGPKDVRRGNTSVDAW